MPIAKKAKLSKYERTDKDKMRPWIALEDRVCKCNVQKTKCKSALGREKTKTA